MKKRIETKIKSLSKDFGIDLQVVKNDNKYEIHTPFCVLIYDISEGEVFAYLCGMFFALKHMNAQAENPDVIKNTQWHGRDTENAVNIFENGLVIRWVAKQCRWQAICKYPSQPKTFGIGWIDEKQLVQIFFDGWANKEKDAFLSFHGITWSEYLESSVVQKISDVLDYFGAENLFDECDPIPLTVRSVCKQLKIKYHKGYE